MSQQYYPNSSSEQSLSRFEADLERKREERLAKKKRKKEKEKSKHKRHHSSDSDSDSEHERKRKKHKSKDTEEEKPNQIVSQRAPISDSTFSKMVQIATGNQSSDLSMIDKMEPNWMTPGTFDWTKKPIEKEIVSAPPPPVSKARELNDQLHLQSSYIKPNQDDDHATHRYQKRDTRLETPESDLRSSMPNHSQNSPQSSRNSQQKSLEEANALKSQIMKAKMTGKKELAEELQRKMDALLAVSNSVITGDLRDHATQSSTSNNFSSPPSNVRLLESIDERGVSRVTSNMILEHKHASVHHQPKSKSYTHDEDGQRVKYFADDDNVSLEDMVARERLSKYDTAPHDGLSSMDRSFADNLMKSRNFKEESMFDRQLDGDGDVDYSQWESSVSQKKRNQSLEEVKAQERSRQIQSQKMFDQVTDKCQHCLKNVPAKSILSLASHTALVSKSYPIVSGHCIIIPHDHIASSTAMDDSVWQEVRNYMESLCKLFEAENKTPIFMETVQNHGKWKHSVIECIPLDKRDADVAPFFFRKAIQEAGSEWATHRKLHEFKSPKTVRNVIPKNFSYFFVQFGMDFGLAHQIEDKEDVSKSFGHSIISGILEDPDQPYHGKRRPSHNNMDMNFTEFLLKWKKYDWTKQV